MMMFIDFISTLLELTLFIAYFWYWIKTIIVLGKRSIGLGVAGFFFAPLAQIGYYFAEKKNLHEKDKKLFLRSFIFMIFIPMVWAIYTISYVYTHATFVP